MYFVDAHHHLWDLQRVHYPWLMAHGVRRFFGDPAPIQRNYLLQDLLSESQQWVPAKTVHVQVGAADDQALAETHWLREVGDLDRGGTRPDALVAYVDLSQPNCGEQISLHRQVSRVRGVRQIVGRHPEEDRQTGSGALLGNRAWRECLAELAAQGLSFDLQLVSSQYESAWEIFSAIPKLPVALCHLGSPWDQSPAGLAHWSQWMSRFAELPQVYCKVSGLGMFRADWKPDDVQPLVESVIEWFGPQRVMLGSNFPVDRLYGSYDRIWTAYQQITSALSAEDQRAVFAGTAERFYRI